MKRLARTSCECGCGSLAPLDRRGKPQRYILGHNRRGKRKRRLYKVEDRGYQTPCWITDRSPDWNGYVRIRVDGRYLFAHRHFFEERYGPIPEGKHLDHLCRERACCNPEHLDLVTNAENQRRGQNSKLGHYGAFSAKHAFISTTLTKREIADMLGVSESAVGLVINGRSWQLGDWSRGLETVG